MTYFTAKRHFSIMTALSSVLICSLSQGYAKPQSSERATEHEVRAMVERLEKAFNSVSIEQLQDIVVSNKGNDEWVDDIREIERQNGSVSANLDITRIYRKGPHIVAETRTTFVVNGKSETANARMLYFFATTQDGLKLEKTEHPTMKRSNELITEAMRLGTELATATNNRDYAAISSIFHLTDAEAKGIRDGDIEMFKTTGIYWLYEIGTEPSLTLKARGASRVNTPNTAKATVLTLDKEGQVLSTRSLMAKWFPQAATKNEVCCFLLRSVDRPME